MAAFRTSLTTKDLFNMLEVIDVHDALKKEAYDIAALEAKNKK